MNVIHQYADAGFNMVLGGNIRRGCQLNGTIPTPATATEAFECLASQLPQLDKLGLKVAWADGGYNSSGVSSVDLIAGRVVGGVTDQINFSRPAYPTTPEVAWVVKQLEGRNLSHIVAQFFLHDDVVTNNQAINDAVNWLKVNKPSIVAQTNCGNQGYDTLYQDRQPLFVPEEYAIDGTVTEETRQVAVDAQLALFESNQYISQRYRLLAWPLFALGDGGGVQNLASASLVRVQVYSALAYGMKGLYYYCCECCLPALSSQFVSVSLRACQGAMAFGMSALQGPTRELTLGSRHQTTTLSRLSIEMLRSMASCYSRHGTLEPSETLHLLCLVHCLQLLSCLSQQWMITYS